MARDVRKRIEELKPYEDTGLTPDEINALRDRNVAMKIKEIEGMTIENRAAKMQSLPDEVFEEVKKCNVILKGPMVTPRASDPWPNLISANSLLRRGLELFAAVRPIKIPEKGIDWTFFRENI